MSHVSRVWVAVVLLVFGMRILSADDPNKGTSSSERIDLGHWKLTLPVDAAGAYNGHASEVAAGQLSSDFRSSHFRIDDNGSIEFWCPVTGARTEGTEFPRTELREMLDPQNSSAVLPRRRRGGRTVDAGRTLA